MSLRPFQALVVKDLRVFFTDRHSVILSIAAPIALASFMAAIFGGAGASPPSKIPIVVVDRDGGPVARAIVAGSKAEGRLVATTSGLGPALADVRMGRAVVAVEIPPGFGDAAAGAMVGDNPPPDLKFHLDPTHRSDVSLAQGVLTRVILEAVASDSMAGTGGLLDDLVPGGKPGSSDQAEFLALFDGIEGADRDEFLRTFPGLEDLVEAKPGVKMPYVARDVSILSDGAEGDREALAAHAFAGMVVQFVLFSAVEWGVGLLTERRRGLWKRLRSAPVSTSTLLASKVAGSFLASSMITGIVFGFGALVFGFRARGSLVGLILMGAAFAWMASNFGLMVAALGRSPQGARSVAILAVLVMVMLGGGWIPGFLFPAWLQAITPAIPARWAIDGFDGLISRGYSTAEAGPMLLALAGFGVGFGAVALLAFRRAEPA